jgi:hypothetical protein
MDGHALQIEDVVVMRGTPAMQRLLMAFLCMASVARIFSQSPEETKTGIRVMVRSVGSGSAAKPVSLTSALARSGNLDAVIIAADGVDLLESATRASCSLAVYVSSNTAEGGSTRSSWTVLDPLSGRTLAEGTVEGPDPTERDLAEFWWLPVVDAAEKALPAVSRTLVRIEALPGTRISGLGPDTVVVPESGVAELALRIPGTYKWRAESTGAYPESGHLVAMEQGISLVIPRRELRSFALESGLYMAQFPDLWFSWRLISDYLLVRAGLTQFLAGLYFVDASSDLPAPPLFMSLPLVQPGLGLGAYFLPPDATLRPYLSSAVFTRLLVAKGFPVQLDRVAPFGITAMAGAEWKVFGHTGIFLELGMTLYPCPSGALMVVAKQQETESTQGYSYGENWFLEFPLFRFGVRVTL